MTTRFLDPESGTFYWYRSLIEGLYTLLGGSWGVISGVISRVRITITHIRGPIARLITYNYP